MPDWGAIGQGIESGLGVSKALTSTYQDMLKAKREEESFQMEKQLQPLKQKTAETQLAISEEGLKASVEENKRKKLEQEFKDKPTNLKQVMSVLKLTPDNEDDVLKNAEAFNIDPKTGIGRREDVQKFYTDFLMKNEAGKIVISKQIDYTQKQFENTRQNYQKALERGDDPAKLRQLKTSMDMASGELSKWDQFNKGVMTAREASVSLTEMNDKFKQSGQWDKLDNLTQVGLEAAASQGNVNSYNAIVGKAQVAETASEKLTSKEESDRLKRELDQQRIDAINRRIDVMSHGGAGGPKLSPTDKILLTKGIADLSKSRPDAEKAVGHIDNLDQAIAFAEKPGVTGKGGWYKSMLTPCLQRAGIRTEAMDDAETYQRFIDVVKGPMRLELIGPGPVTDQEQKWIKQMAGGGGVGQAAALNLFKSYRKRAEDRIRSYNKNITNMSKRLPDADINTLYDLIDIPGVKNKENNIELTDIQKRQIKERILSSKKSGISVQDIKDNLIKNNIDPNMFGDLLK